jgi:hypothetical protein
MECLTFSRRPRSRVGPQSCCENGHSLLSLHLRRVLKQLTVRSVDLCTSVDRPRPKDKLAAPLQTSTMLFRNATPEQERRQFEEDLVTERTQLLSAKDDALSYNKQVVSTAHESWSRRTLLLTLPSVKTSRMTSVPAPGTRKTT